MMNVFAINFSPSQIDRQFLLDFLDTRPEILNWLAVNESLVLVVSSISTYQLQEIINTAFPSLSFFIFFIHKDEINGRQSPNVWDFINHPKSSGYWDGKLKGLQFLNNKKP